MILPIRSCSRGYGSGPRGCGVRIGRLALLSVAAVAAVLLVPGPFWENDLSKLTPVPVAALLRDMRLRQELGAPDVRYVLALHAVSAEQALQAAEALRPRLDGAVAQGIVAGYDMAARYLPSIQTQRRRQQALPTPEQVRRLIAEAVIASGFRADVFEPFQADVEMARQAPPMTMQMLGGTALAMPVSGLLLVGTDGVTALVSLIGLHDPQALAAVVGGSGAQLMDLKEVSVVTGCGLPWSCAGGVGCGWVSVGWHGGFGIASVATDGACALAYGDDNVMDCGIATHLWGGVEFVSPDCVDFLRLGWAWTMRCSLNTPVIIAPSNRARCMRCWCAV